MFWISFLTVFTLSSSYAVTQIGNGIIGDKKDMFTATLSKRFLSSNQIDPETLEIFGQPTFGSNDTNLLPPRGLVMSFYSAYPELVHKTYEEIKTTFSSHELIPVSNCALAFLVRSQSTVVGVSTWGQGRGIAILMPAGFTIDQAIRETLESVKLEPGACAWTN